MVNKAGLNVCIAVDLNGGDGGAEVVIAGMLEALASDPHLKIVAVGPAPELARVETLAGSRRSAISLVEAAGVLPADVNAARAIRRGRDSSMSLTLEQVSSGQAQAAVSGGSTGALMGLSRHLLGMLPGVERPALMAAIPTVGQPVWMLDLGANVSVDARRLLEFAQLGHVAFNVLEGREPRIGLLNIGTEPSKGPDVVREAARLIDDEVSLDYAGFVEADQVFAGAVDLVVCDGFAGNVLLKSAEGAVRLMFSSLKAQVKGSLFGWMARSRMRSLHDMFDPSRHNGAPMLGVRGTVIKSHGSACARGFARAIELAALEVRRDLVNRLEQQLLASY